MAEFQLVTLILAVSAIAVAISTVPYTIAAIEFRQRDNGLAYLLLVAGVGVWNAMFVAQLLTTDPLIQSFFLALSVVGAVQAGLGSLLFATTASSTPDTLSRRDLYATVGILAGLDIVLAVTASVHRFYWAISSGPPGATGFASVDPGLGYWLHTVFLVVLFGAGVVLFFQASRNRPSDPYLKAYVVAGSVTVIAVAGSNIPVPGGFGVSSIAVVALTSVGWLHASRGRPLAWLVGRSG